MRTRYGLIRVTKTPNLYLSATSITDFLSCPAKFAFRQEWSCLDQSDNLGLRVHRAMELDKEPEEAEEKKMFHKLKELMHVHQIRLTAREKKDKFEIVKGVMFTRIMDGVGTCNRVPCVIDYKTADRPWEQVEGIYPQVLSIQAAAYLYPLEPKWPTILYFLTSPKYGQTQILEYKRNAKDEKNLFMAISLIQWAWNNKHLPYNRGKTCKWCDYARICFKSHGWRDHYAKHERTDK
jgi:CRISPR/Cas system-associated exonuclease Cas4 (RecB family)